MNETKPWTGHPELDKAPPDAVTLEFTPDEVLQILAAYAGQQRGEKFAAHAFMQTKIADGAVSAVRLTYWPRKDVQ